GSTNGIAVVRGAFSGGVLSWGAPNLVISGSDNTVVYDKEWMAADSLSGTLYLTFTKFTSASDEIDFCRNTTDNVGAWTAPIKLSSTTDNGLVQGSRVAVGPTGDVWTTWNAIGNPLTDIYDYMRVRRSTTNGASFGAEATGAQQILSNFGSGAPGFNRGTGFTFPGMAVDRGTGPHRGRVYLTWNESINFYDDNFGSLIAGNAVNEIETNDTPATATAFTMGKNLFGGMSTANDFDYWKFNGTQGQTIICELDSVYTTTLDASFRLFCSDGSTRLAYSESGFGGDNISQSLIVFTLPSTGTYYLRVASTTNDPLKPPGTGGYRIRTTLDTPSAGERARDHRDIFVTTSDNGTAWTTPVRVNGDVGHLDDWLPEVAVAPNGNAYCQWYDWRDASAPICGGASMTYLARSTDGGATWTDGSPVSSAVTNWTTTSANIAPNQGDYTALFANTNAVYSIWSDGRNGDPDAYMAAVNLSFTAVQVSLAATDVTPDRVRITWASSGGAGVVGTVYRRGGSDAWTVLGDVTSDGSGMLSYEDRAVTPGTRYVYRIGIHDPSGEILSGEVTIDVPLALAFGVRSVGANPSPGSVRVACSLPDAGTATLELIDVAGRRVDQQTLTGPGAPEVELAQGRSLAPGVYLVRLTHAGRSATTRVAVIR
ncbi:MAG: pre-peptidase C-terminal domain-containing protein, partial [Candidatus Eisenbacteria bacterium]|nr:pre-peptidase C-terminal domain-containing protein [Candidatus Eisenbacteria bacterium]